MQTLSCTTQAKRKQAFCHTEQLIEYRPWIRKLRYLSSGYRALGAFGQQVGWRERRSGNHDLMDGLKAGRRRARDQLPS